MRLKIATEHIFPYDECKNVESIKDEDDRYFGFIEVDSIPKPKYVIDMRLFFFARYGKIKGFQKYIDLNKFLYYWLDDRDLILTADEHGSFYTIFIDSVYYQAAELCDFDTNKDRLKQYIKGMLHLEKELISISKT